MYQASSHPQFTICSVIECLFNFDNIHFVSSRPSSTQKRTHVPPSSWTSRAISEAASWAGLSPATRNRTGQTCTVSASLYLCSTCTAGLLIKKLFTTVRSRSHYIQSLKSAKRIQLPWIRILYLPYCRTFRSQCIYIKKNGITFCKYIFTSEFVPKS